MDAHKSSSANSRHFRQVNEVNCAECHCLSGSYWVGWGAYRIDNPDLNEPPALAFYCPACAHREFDRHSRRV
jgi:hypothetical protein